MMESMGESRIRTNAVWMLLGNGCYAFMQWIQLSILAKLSSSEDLGSYTLALAITAPVFLFLGLQLRQILVTDAKNEFFFSDYYTLRIFSLAFSFLLVVGYALIIKSGFLVLYLVAILKVIEGLAEIFNARQQAGEQMKYIALSLSLKGLSVTVCMFVGIWFFHSLSFGLLLAVFSTIAVLYFNDYRNCRKLIAERRIIKFNKERIKSLLIRGLPLGIVMFLVSLNANVSKYIVEYFKGTELQGIYSTITYCLAFGSFATIALGQSLTPGMSRRYAFGDFSGFKRLCRKYISVTLLTGLGIFIFSWFFGEPLLKILFSDWIAAYHDLFTVVMFSGIIVCVTSALGYILSSMRAFKVQPYINGLALMVNIICCYLLLDKFGLYGIVYASIASLSVQGLFTAYIIARETKRQEFYYHTK